MRFCTTLDRIEGDNGEVRTAWLSHTSQREATAQPTVTERWVESLDVDLVVMAMGYRIDPDDGRAKPGDADPQGGPAAAGPPAAGQWDP
jgi:hypothetical protein